MADDPSAYTLDTMPRNAAEMLCTLLARRLEWEFPGNLSKLAGELNLAVKEITAEAGGGDPKIVALRRGRNQAVDDYVGELRRARDMLVTLHHTAAQERPNVYANIPKPDADA